MRAMMFGVAALLFAGGAALAQDQAPADATQAAPADATQAPADATQAPAGAAAPADASQAPAQDAQAPAEPPLPDMTGPQILIATAMGNITIQLDAVRAPKTTANIIRYVRAKHYDNTVFYRVVHGALDQMGSWDARGKGKSELPGKVPLESSNGLSNVRGTVGLARGEETDSGGADFFINVGDESPLDAAKDVAPNTTGYAVFGKVIAGMDVVDQINRVPVGGVGPFPEQAPAMPILISKVTIVPGTYQEPAPVKKPAAKKK